MKKFLVLVVLIVAVASLYVFNTRNEPFEDTFQEQDFSTTTDVDLEFPNESGPRLLIGNADADLTILEFIDYKCPNCNAFHRTTKLELEKEYGDQIVFEIHQTPFIGPDSGRAARGAYCSQIHGDVFSGYNDGVFNYMYDNYYATGNFAAEFEDILSEDILSDVYTTAGGQTENAFIECIRDTEQINLYINADQLLAAESEVRGTPSFVIADTPFIGPQPLSVFRALIESEI